MEKMSKMVDERIAWEGCSVLLDINDGDRVVFARLSPSATMKIGNVNLSLRPLIGSAFGSLFQVETGRSGPTLVRVAAETDEVKRESESQLKDTDKDNRLLMNNNSAQSLSSEDIETMRRDGATGDQIIEALIANSSTFESKTPFSQEKYKLKKQKKYAPRVLLRRPFARSICEAYFKKHSEKIEHLRVDALSLLLSLGNVSAYSDVLVVDMVGGMVTGAVAERLGGTGHVCNIYFGEKPYPMDIVRIFNFSNETCDRIRQISFPEFSSYREKILGFSMTNKNNSSSSQSNRVENTNTESKLCVSETSDNCFAGDASSISVEDGPKDNDNLSSKDDSFARARNDTVPMVSEHFSGAIKKSNSNYENTLSASNPFKSLKAGRPPPLNKCKCGNKMGLPGFNLAPIMHAFIFHFITGCSAEYISSETSIMLMLFCSLVIAAPQLDSWKIVQELFPLISYSASFAIYHQYLQPLAECMHHLQSSKLAISLQISEPWLREYQVLPCRTHPHMQMSSHGGYILSGIRICNAGVVVRKEEILVDHVMEAESTDNGNAC